MEWRILWSHFILLTLFVGECSPSNEQKYSYLLDMNDIFSSFLHLFHENEEKVEILSLLHSKWQSKIRIKHSQEIVISTIFHSDPSTLYSRWISSDCDLVTWIIRWNDSFFGQVTCFWSLHSLDHCGTICKYPIIPQVQNDHDTSFLQFLTTLSAHSLDHCMELEIIPIQSNTTRRLSTSTVPSPSYPSIPNTNTLRPWTISSPQKLFSLNGQTYDNFGVSLGYHNDVAIVGAVTRDHGGRVYVYYREGNNFIQDPLLLTGYPPTMSPSITSSSSPPTTSTHDYFGWSIDIFDRTIAVGAYHTLELTTEFQSVGAVYIFYQLSSGWNIESFLRLPTPQQVNGKDNRNVEVTITPKYDQFGWSLGLWDSTLVVGAYGDDDQGTSSGAVYAFERINGLRYHWTVTQKILPNDGSGYDNFGWSVAIYDNVTIIGAYGDRNNQHASYSGSVYLFQRTLSSTSLYSHWTQIQKLVPFDSYSNGFYGWSVDIWKDLIAVGSKSSADGTTVSSNGVYIYRQSNTEWKFETKLIPPSNRIIPNYGTSVSLYEESILVGAHRDLVGTSDVLQPGSAFMYSSQYQEKDKSMNWILLKELKSNSSTERNMKFGVSVSLHDDVLLIGATLGDGVMADTGTVFVFIRSIDFSSFGHPLSGSTYFTLVLFLPLLFLGTCIVITLARVFMKPDDHTSGSTSGSNHNNDDSSVHSSSSSDYFHSSHQLVSEASSRGSSSSIRDDEESVHSLAGLVRYQLLKSIHKR